MQSYTSSYIVNKSQACMLIILKISHSFPLSHHFLGPAFNQVIFQSFGTKQLYYQYLNRVIPVILLIIEELPFTKFIQPYEIIPSICGWKVMIYSQLNS